jgi:OOP family OmpA-OmpF porin
MKRLSILFVIISLFAATYATGCAGRCVDCPHVVKTVILEGVNFAFDKADLLPVAYPILEEDLRMLKANTKLQVSVEGHCDIRGSDAYNQKLSERRAKSVYAYFVSQGIAADRMKTIGYGRSRPLVPNTSEENMYKNRRVEIKIIKIGD